MEPTRKPHWSGTHFAMKATLTFWVKRSRRDEVPVSDMLSALVLADREAPWRDGGVPARLNVQSPIISNDGVDVLVYNVHFQSACYLLPNQLPAYVRYTAHLAEHARRFLGRPAAVEFIASRVTFEGPDIIFSAE